ncbi:MAG: hypothetical protein U1F76_29420 [Candidatus Competibacteraceae bacterium]
MTVAFFQIKLSVKPKSGGGAELVPPEALQDVNYRFILVKEGGEEGIVKLDESDEVLGKVVRSADCKELTQEQLESLKQSYPQPKLKQKFRPRQQTQEQGRTTTAEAEPFELDAQGNRLIDTFQTVRSGFYLIDVPVEQG